MAPPIRYATAQDGTSLAIATVGAGTPVLFLPPMPFSHLEAGWQVPGVRHFFELLGRHAEVGLFDGRGTGLSDRERMDFSLETQTGDIEAVARRLEWSRFALCGFFNASPVAIAFAAARPEAVSKLVLWGGFARGADVYPFPFADDPRAAEAHWPLLLDTAARTWTAGDDEEVRHTVDFFRACVTPEGALRAFTAAREYDLTSLLLRVTAPTLVLHRRDSATQRLEVSRALAAGIPDAELQLLPGAAASPFSGDIESGVAAIAAFLGVATPLERQVDADARAGAVAIGLTARESEVLRLVAQGRANKEIASILGLSINTVERHLTNLYVKIECRSRSEATAYALRHGYA